MATLVIDPSLEEQIRKERAALGADRYDEVWEGTYIMSPAPNNEHQKLVAGLTAILHYIVAESGIGDVFAGANVSDREVEWKQNYREPDVVVTLKGGRAKDCGTHFCGGPDFLIEITSSDDLTREKLAFYAKIGVRELMIVDRDPWSLELYRFHGDELKVVGTSRLDEPSPLTSDVLPVTFRLLPGNARPKIEIIHRDGVQRWLV
jgi:Uma2 family endonuclease